MHLDAVEETNKGVACGDSPLSLYFVYQVGLSVVYFFIYILFNSFDYLFGYCKWFLTRKEWNVEAYASVYKKKKKKAKTDNKKRSLLSVLVSFYLPSIKRWECFNFSAVTLLFILLTSSLFTWDSLLSLCQSPMPSHFCTDDATQSAEDEGQLCKDFVSHITKWIFKCLYLCWLNAIDIFHFSCGSLLMIWYHPIIPFSGVFNLIYHMVFSVIVTTGKCLEWVCQYLLYRVIYKLKKIIYFPNKAYI